MNTKQKIRLNMYLAVRNFVNLNEKTASGIPKFLTAFKNLENAVAEIQKIAGMQVTNKKGLALDKNRLRKKLIAATVKNSNKVSILAKSNKNDTLLHEVKMNESELAILAAVTLRDKAQIIYDRVQANIGALTEQGITEENQKQFLELINSFNNAIASPRTGITEKRQATQMLPLLFDTADAEINIMDLAAGSAKDEYTDFHNGYKNSRKLVDTSSGRLALRAAAVDRQNKVPLSGVTFTFRSDSMKSGEAEGNGEIVKKTSDKGRFVMKSMVSGSYKVGIIKEGYKVTEVPVTVVDGERSELVVELEKA